MNRATLQEELVLAERNVESGERRIKRQLAVATDLDREGQVQAAEAAWQLLRQLTELQASAVALRDQIKRNLDDAPSD
jgi:hypothetical protein